MTPQRRTGLDVWLYGHRVARLTEPARYRYRLDFTDEALDVFGQGARVLSLAIPFDTRAISDSRGPGDRPVSAFLEGLLPEGNLRRHVATSLGVATVDTMSLLRAVGADCAGAVRFLPEGVAPSDGSVRDLSSDEVNRLVADLPTYHLPDGITTPQASLAGIQDKLLLAARPGGSWGWPEDGAVSSHIIKPEPLGNAVVPHLIQSEDWAMSVARASGIPGARTRLDSFDGRTAIIITRYDRTADGARLHQEDVCQALGLDPNSKYESTAEYERHGSRLRRLVKTAAHRALDPEAFRRSLLSAVTFNVVMGNGDAHSKNYSLLIGRRGDVSLAPLYDCAPLMYLEPRFKGTGHVINGRTNIDGVTESDLVAEAQTWGLSEPKARGTVRATTEQVYESVRSTEPPPGTEHVRGRLDALWTRRGWAVP